MRIIGQLINYLTSRTSEQNTDVGARFIQDGNNYYLVFENKKIRINFSEVSPSVADNIVTFSNTTGDLKDSGTAISSLSNYANKALSNLASVAINTSLIGDTNNTDDLGSDSIEWKDVWAHNIKHNDASNPDLGISTTANNGKIKLTPHGTGIVEVGSSVVSDTTNTDDVGSPSIKFRKGCLGSVFTGVANKTDNYTVTDVDGLSLITVSVVNKTVTLPTAADNTGRVITIKKNVSGNGTIAIKGEAAGETIEGISGTTGIALDVYQEFVTLQCTGTVWEVINWYVPEIEYAPTVTGTNYTVGYTSLRVKKTHLTGMWYISGTITGALSSTTNIIVLTVANTTFKNVTNQAAAAYVYSAAGPSYRTMTRTEITSNASTIIISASDVFDNLFIQITASLNAKPSYVV